MGHAQKENVQEIIKLAGACTITFARFSSKIGVDSMKKVILEHLACAFIGAIFAAACLFIPVLMGAW